MQAIAMARGAARLTQLAVRHPPSALMVARVIREHLSYLDVNALADLADATLDAEQGQQPGELLEAGCALGGSALVMAAAKRRSRPLRVFDVFGMIPPPSDKDGPDVQARYQLILEGQSSGIGGDRYYGYQPELLQRVTQTFVEHGLPITSNAVQLVPGLFQDTLPREQSEIAVAHLDGDWYESVAVCLRTIAPRLVSGGRIVVDDYDAWSGCRRAVDEFLADPAGPRLVIERRARVHLVRVA